VTIPSPPFCWPSHLPLWRGLGGCYVYKPSHLPLWRKSASWRSGVCARGEC